MSYNLQEACTDNKTNTHLIITGAKENNLKDLSLSIPHNKLIVISGVSGSGKSTLAFDTIYAEGGRRYIETFSPYTRQFLDRLHRPNVQNIEHIRPALALEQRNKITSSRSTVGTLTEINDYLKVLWGNLASLYCPKCGKIVSAQSAAEAGNILQREILAKSDGVLFICFRIILSTKASLDALVETLESQGFLRYYSLKTKSVQKLEEIRAEIKDSCRLKELYIIVDRLPTPFNENDFCELNDRLVSAIHQSYTYGHQKATVIWISDCEKNQATHRYDFSSHYHCASCDLNFNPPKPSLFSFNSPIGACPTCKGFGTLLLPDPELCIPNPNKSIKDKAIACIATQATRGEYKKLCGFCAKHNIPTDVAWRFLKEEDRKKLFEGVGSKHEYKGLNYWFEKLNRKRHKVHVRVFLSRYRSEFMCPECCQTRLTKQASWYKLLDHTISEVFKFPLSKLLEFLNLLSVKQNSTLSTAIEEAKSRAKYLIDIGLEYLTLDRQSKTLSGGELQRVSLTSILGARLVNTVLVLDEPTIGLHSVDTSRLLKTLYALRDKGNTVIVVEHDPSIIKAADEIIDLGPKAGEKGGEIIHQGSLPSLLKKERSLTAQYLRQELVYKRNKIPLKLTSKSKLKIPSLTICGARANNLKNITVDIPLRHLVVLCGPSGSGKSTLVHNCLWQPYSKSKLGIDISDVCKAAKSNIQSIKGLNNIDEISLIDQEPIGKTPRSNPATYTGCWDIIRQCFAETELAKQLGLSKSAFSFNTDGGRCPICKGAGAIRVEMQFLADVFVPCETCLGSRFQDKVLNVLFCGKSILDILQMTISEVIELFETSRETEKTAELKTLLAPLCDLGLSYLKLGHPLNMLSGGEAQRLKLASFLSPSYKNKCLFILDEPSTGLHPYNIMALLATFDKLIENGHSILCIEHNLDIISQADWIIELGPEGGENGGKVVLEGNTDELLKNSSTQTSSTLKVLKADKILSIKDSKLKSINPYKSSCITIKNAKHHNLKNISLSIPHNELTVITGVSGSGKSTIAFDIIFAEGQRRYIDCLSPYARQYLKQLDHPDVELLDSLPPTIAVSQKTAPPLGLSTIATTTEIYQYLRLLYAKVGTQRCVVDNTPVSKLGADAILQEICRRHEGKRLFLFAPIVSGRKGSYQELFQRALGAEISEAKIDGKIVSLYESLKLERHKLHYISLLVSSIGKTDKNSKLLKDAVEQCLLLGNGSIEICTDVKTNNIELFSISRMCPKCGRGYRDLDPQDFSFRSARGVCKECDGYGVVFSRLEESRLCPGCNGSRIGLIGQHVELCGKKIYELTQMNPKQLLEFFNNQSFDLRITPIIEPILSEITNRLKIISSVGLDYLELNRDSSSVSSGEAQRLRLARSLGSPLSGVCYILDEPSIGLHPVDQKLLMNTLFYLRNAGNTVIVVEHDDEIMEAADHIIDIGPQGGAAGGQVVACGKISDIEACESSLTGFALRNRKKANRQISVSINNNKFSEKFNFIVLNKASANNLKKIDVRFAINKLNGVAGVSGAGKSSLVHETLVPALCHYLNKSKVAKNKQTWQEISNVSSIKRIQEIDQTPVGKTVCSIPASYLGIWTEIRNIYSMLPEAKAQGWTASHFSFNTGKGQCPNCKGRGEKRLPMSFLPDAVSTCEICKGLRYNEETLEVLFQELSLGDVLSKTISECAGIFINHPKILRPLEYAVELGLGYLTIGQPTWTLSGGEAQRLKIAKELGTSQSSDILYILDEPTIGLHMIDVDKLIAVLKKLIDKGNTVLIIEHNLDVLRACDWLIELGPKAGAEGGNLLFEGHPSEMSKKSIKTPTKTALLGE